MNRGECLQFWPGHIRSRADNKNAPAPLGNTKVCSVKLYLLNGVGGSFECSHKPFELWAKGRREKARDVFHHEVLWTRLIYDASELVNKFIARIRPVSPANLTEPLARGTTHYHVQLSARTALPVDDGL
jgi:hypothetical protein